MRRWFVAAGFLAATFSHSAVPSGAAAQRWTGSHRLNYLTPDHKPTAKLPDARLA